MTSCWLYDSVCCCRHSTANTAFAGCRCGSDYECNVPNPDAGTCQGLSVHCLWQCVKCSSAMYNVSCWCQFICSGAESTYFPSIYMYYGVYLPRLFCCNSIILLSNICKDTALELNHAIAAAISKKRKLGLAKFTREMRLVPAALVVANDWYDWYFAMHATHGRPRRVPVKQRMR